MAQFPGRSDAAQAWLPWYGTKRWQDTRAAQLAREPLCRMCLAEMRVTAATVADHVVEHKGDPALFWNTGNLQSLCSSHHSRDKQREERGRPISRIGADGWPVEAYRPDKTTRRR